MAGDSQRESGRFEGIDSQKNPIFQQDTKEYLIRGVPKSEFSRSQKKGG